MEEFKGAEKMTFYCNKRDNPNAPEGMECTHCGAVGSECPEWDPDTEWFTKEVSRRWK